MNFSRPTVTVSLLVVSKIFVMQRSTPSNQFMVLDVCQQMKVVGWVDVGVLIIYLPKVLCLSYSCHIIPVVLSYSCRNCGMLSYSLSFSNQTDQVDEREGFGREGLEMER